MMKDIFSCLFIGIGSAIVMLGVLLRKGWLPYDKIKH